MRAHLTHPFPLVWLMVPALLLLQSILAGAALPLSEQPVSETTHATRFGAITVSVVPADRAIPRTYVRTPRYDIYTELGDQQIPPLEIGLLLEAARSHYEAFFEITPPADQRWPVEIYANEERYRGAGRKDAFDAIGGGRYMWHTKVCYLYWQPAGVHFTRGLILHEVAHQFHHRSGRAENSSEESVRPEHGREELGARPHSGIGLGKARFITEAIATFFEGHTWDATQAILRVGAPFERYRIEEALRNTFTSGMTFADIERRGTQTDYPSTWGLLHFLVFRYPQQARDLLSSASSAEEVWRVAFGDLTLTPEFIAEYNAWLKELIAHPDLVHFTGWKAVLAANRLVPLQRAVVSAQRTLGSAAPASLSALAELVKSTTTAQDSAAMTADPWSALTTVVGDVAGLPDSAMRREALAALSGLSLRAAVVRDGRHFTLELRLQGPVTGTAKAAIVATASMPGVLTDNRGTLVVPAEASGPVRFARLDPQRITRSFSLKIEAKVAWSGVSIPLSQELQVFRSVPLWQVVGPCEDPPTGDTVPFAEPFTLERGVPGMGGKIERWRLCTWADSAASDDRDLMIDLRARYEKEQAVAYATCWIESPDARAAVLTCGSDDGIQVWLNGEVVHRQPTGRYFASRSDRVPIRLTAGTNRLVLCIRNQGGDWKFAAEVVRPDGTSFDDLQFRSRP